MSNLDRDIKWSFYLALLTRIGLNDSEASKNGYYIARERHVKLLPFSHSQASRLIRVLCRKP